ncbi:MAG: polar amino acid ABC transporter permease [Kaistia sp. SCN 65-12]|jgi:polar amino acid transport system permease protein|nr:MAG: polar amino acid ABC transporter permease [Kaistia sp. SCN 65-12]
MNLSSFIDVLHSWPGLLSGLGMTVVLTLISCLLGVILGTLCAWASQKGPKPLRWFIRGYVEFFRNTPFLGQIFFIFFGLPALGLRMDPFTAALVALTINLTAYACEIVRAGIEATPAGQFEAASSLGLKPAQVFFLVIIPPALQRVWPAMTSQLVIILLASALCSQISVAELSYEANMIASRTFRNFEAYIVVTLIYLGLAISFRALLSWIGRRFVYGEFATVGQR